MDKYICHICGYPELDKPPWGLQGKSSSFDICPCCGFEFGYQDCQLSAYKNNKRKWIESGAPWFEKELKPDDWDLQIQLMNIETRRKSEKWHNYGKNEVQAIKTIKEMARLFQAEGMAYFNQFNDFPSVFTEIKLDEITKEHKRIEKLGYLPTPKKLALILSRVHEYLGNKNQQEIFYQWGIE